MKKKFLYINKSGQEVLATDQIHQKRQPSAIVTSDGDIGKAVAGYATRSGIKGEIKFL